MNILCTPDACPIILGSTCVFYRGSDLVYTGIVTNDSIQVALQKINDTIGNISVGGTAWGSISGTITDQSDLINYISGQLGNYVPLTREITINGVTQDLSQDRFWVVSGGGNNSDYTNSFLLMGG